MRAVSARSRFAKLTQPPLSGPVGAPPDGSHPGTGGSPETGLIMTAAAGPSTAFARVWRGLLRLTCGACSSSGHRRHDGQAHLR